MKRYAFVPLNATCDHLLDYIKLVPGVPGPSLEIVEYLNSRHTPPNSDSFNSNKSLWHGVSSKG